MKYLITVEVVVEADDEPRAERRVREALDSPINSDEAIHGYKIAHVAESGDSPL